MKSFKQALLKFQALTLREQLVAVAAAVVVLYFLLDWALLTPQLKQNKTLQGQIALQKTELNALTKVMAELSTSQPVEDLSKDRAERDDLRARVAQAETLFGQAASQAPLGELLRAMVVARPDLTLVSFKTLPSEVFYRPPPAAAPSAQGAASAPKPAAPPQLTLYRHGIEVAVKGKYPALLAYLQGLQSSPNRIFWSSVKLDVAAYPDEMLSVIIYTLSDRADTPLG